jgi:hypothetical protein
MLPSLPRRVSVPSRGTRPEPGPAGKLVNSGSPLPGCWVLQNSVTGGPR